MTDTTLFIVGSALFDSVSTTQQMVILILLFSTARPVRTSLGFILGVCVAYLACGLVGLAFVDQLNAMVKLFVPNLDGVPDRSYYLAQSLMGVALLVAGPVYWWFQRRSKKAPMENRLLARLQKMNFGVAFVLGAVLSATSFPAALPYVASLEKIATSALPMERVGFVVLYNVVYGLPLLVLFVLFVALKESILPKLHIHVQRWNTIASIVMLSGMGLFLLVDSFAFFWTGKPILQNRFL